MEISGRLVARARTVAPNSTPDSPIWLEAASPARSSTTPATRVASADTVKTTAAFRVLIGFSSCLRVRWPESCGLASGACPLSCQGSPLPARCTRKSPTIQMAAMSTTSGVNRATTRSGGNWLPAITTDRTATTTSASSTSVSEAAR